MIMLLLEYLLFFPLIDYLKKTAPQNESKVQQINFYYSSNLETKL